MCVCVCVCDMFIYAYGVAAYKLIWEFSNFLENFL